MLAPSERSSRSVMPATRRRDVDGLRLELLATREGQHALREGGAALRRLQGIGHQGRHPRIVADAPLDELEAAHHGRQQIVEIVRDAAGELADRIHLLRLEQRLARLLERLLGVAPLGDVAGDLGEAAQAAIGVADRIDHHVRPEARAVLADPPDLPFRSGPRARRWRARVRARPPRGPPRYRTARSAGR